MTTDWENEGGAVYHRPSLIVCPLCGGERPFDIIGIHLMRDHKLPRGTRIHPVTGEELPKYSSAAGLHAWSRDNI